MPKKKRSPAAKDITLRDVINHMEHHFMRMDGRMGLIEKRLGGVEKRLGNMETRLDGVANALDAFRKEFNAFAKGVDDLDERVQKIEDETVGPRVERIERHVGLAA